MTHKLFVGDKIPQNWFAFIFLGWLVFLTYAVGSKQNQTVIPSVPIVICTPETNQ